MERHGIHIIRNWSVTALVIAEFLACDVAVPAAVFAPYEVANVLVALLLGISIGQLNLIAVWAAMGPGNFAVRLPWSLLLTLGMWYALVAGRWIVWEYHSPADAIALGLILLIGVVATQTPLWIAARVFRWRLVGQTDQQTTPTSPSRMQFQLWHLLLAMFLLSLALAPARWVVPGGEIRGDPLDSELLILLSGVAFCNLVATVPCIWGAFLPRQTFFPVIFGWLAYCLLVTALEYGFFSWFFGAPEPDVFGLMYIINITQGATVFGTLLIFRALGFQMRRYTAARDDPDDEPHDSIGSRELAGTDAAP